ncbi:hypothetical protein BJF78_14300 [Pseudonocardia sp. CNS-139]|nr:hypothetical protein BJF78_14300 [Pseudonocardia sp. CNS-139]
MSGLAGRSLFVTGGNTGIGLAAALEFAAAGANVAVYARRADRNEEARAEVEKLGVECLTFAGDVTDEAAMAAAVEATVRRWGGLHYAFNNAGVSQAGAPITQLSHADFDALMDANVRGTFLGMKHQIPAILAAGGGAICNNASASGLVATAHQALYSASKFAVVGMTKAVALELAAQNVRVNAVCPGATTGDMFLRYRREFPELAAKAVGVHPMGRIGLKEEVARAVLFLCRDATFTTGAALEVDGGRTVA